MEVEVEGGRPAARHPEMGGRTLGAGLPARRSRLVAGDGDGDGDGGSGRACACGGACTWSWSRCGRAGGDGGGESGRCARCCKAGVEGAVILGSEFLCPRSMWPAAWHKLACMPDDARPSSSMDRCSSILFAETRSESAARDTEPRCCCLDRRRWGRGVAARGGGGVWGAAAWAPSASGVLALSTSEGVADCDMVGRCPGPPSSRFSCTPCCVVSTAREGRGFACCMYVRVRACVPPGVARRWWAVVLAPGACCPPRGCPVRLRLQLQCAAAKVAASALRPWLLCQKSGLSEALATAKSLARMSEASGRRGCWGSDGVAVRLESCGWSPLRGGEEMLPGDQS